MGPAPLAPWRLRVPALPACHAAKGHNCSYLCRTCRPKWDMCGEARLAWDAHSKPDHINIYMIAVPLCGALTAQVQTEARVFDIKVSQGL